MAGLSGRVQALAWLRWRLMVNGLRSGGAIASAVAGVLVAVMAAVLAALLAAATAAFMLLAGPSGDLDPFQLHVSVFLVLAFFGFLIPLVVGEAKVELAPRRFLVFPVDLRELYWVGVGLGLVSGANLVLYPSFLTVVVCGLLLRGVNGPGLVLGTACFLAALVAWQQVLVAVARAVASHRRSREILTVVGICLVTLIGFLPQFAQRAGWFERQPGAPPEAVVGLFRVAAAVVPALPPVLAAKAVSSRTLAGILGPLAGLVLWAAAGLWLGWRVFRWQLRSSGGGGKRVRAPRRAGGVSPWARWPDLLPPATAGVLHKHLRYLLRSAAGRIGMVTAPVMGIFLALVVSRLSHGVGGLVGRDLGFLGGCFLAGSSIANFAHNLFMWDRDGAPLYFIAPARMWQVLLGLNAAVWLFQAMVLGELVAVWVVLAGLPRLEMLLAGLILTAGMGLAGTGVGLVTSILFPVPREIGGTRNQPALVSSVVSLLAMPAVLVVLLVPAGLLYLAGRPGTAMAAMAGSLALLALAYRFALILGARLILNRRETFLAALRP